MAFLDSGFRAKTRSLLKKTGTGPAFSQAEGKTVQLELVLSWSSPREPKSWSRVWMRRRVLLGIILLCSLPNGAGRRPLLSPAKKVGHCKVTFPAAKEGGGLIALRGGEHGDTDGEDEENKGLPPINETEWQRFVQAPSKSLR